MKKIDLGNQAYLFQTKQFRSNIIRFIFPVTIEVSEIVASSLLPALLIHTNGKFKEEEIFLKELLKAMILDISCHKSREGKQWFYEYTLLIPDDEVIGEQILEKAFLFFIDTLYHPNIKENHFETKEFNKELENLKLNVKNNQKQILDYGYWKVLNEIDLDGYAKEYLLYNHKDQLKTVTAKDVYYFYKKTLSCIKPYVFAFGNLKKETIVHLLETHLWNRSFKNPAPLASYIGYFPHHETMVQIHEKGPYEQSCLDFVYKVKDMSEQDKYLLRMVQKLLDSLSSAILHKNLRIQDKLVYSVSSSCNTRKGLLWITALLYKENKEKAKESIYKSIKSLQNEEYIKPLLQSIKERERILLITEKDYKYNLLEQEIDLFFGMDDSAEKQYEELCHITAHDIALFVPRLYLDIIYFIEGEKNAK